MTYIIVENGISINAIECDKLYADLIGAYPLIDGVSIGEPYPFEKSIQEKLNEDILNCKKCIADLTIQIYS